jgi:soluble lytic murein transglycosylase-like protein
MLDLPPYHADIRAAAEFYFGIPAPVPALVAQITQESGFNPKAQSVAGALGLLQFMPATAQWAAIAGGFGIAAPLDPAWAIRAGTWYDRFLYDRVRAPATSCDRWLFAFSAYNGGEGRVRKRQELSPSPGVWAVTGIINPGILPSNQAENERYGPRILFHLQPRFAHLGPLVCKGS